MLAGLNEPLSTQDIALRDRVHTQVCRSPGNCTPTTCWKASAHPPVPFLSLSSTKDAVGPSEAAGGSSTVSGRENGLHFSRQSTSHTEEGEGKGEERRGGESEERRGEKVRREGERGEVYIGDREKSGR